VTDVLPVAAFEIRDPITVFVPVETDDALFHSVASPSPFPGEGWGEGEIVNE
jgi:hypothetical protein